MELSHLCATCGKTKEETKLLSCSRCHSIQYCSRECQRLGWNVHKEQCGAALHLLSMGSNDENQEMKKIEKESKKISKVLKHSKKKGAPIMCISWTAFGMVGPGMPIPEGVPPNFALKQQALMEFQRGPSSKPGRLGNFGGEQQFRDYYDDIAEYESLWMTFFEHPEHSDHAEHTCGILGTLATIYRQRGMLDECEKVLDMEEKVLERYERHCIGAEQAKVYCFEALKFKYNIIRYNVCLQQERYDENVKLYRELMDYEIRRNLSFEDQMYLFMVTAILKKKATANVVKRLTDEEVMKMVMAPIQKEGGFPECLQGDKKRVALKKCDKCNAEEKAVLQFKACSRCSQVFYCSKTCQKDHWKAHKKDCKAVAKK